MVDEAAKLRGSAKTRLQRVFFTNYYKLTSSPASVGDWTLKLAAYGLAIGGPAIFIWAKRAEWSIAFILMSVAGVLLTAYIKLKPDFSNPVFRVATRTNIEIAAIMRVTYRDFDGSERKLLQKRLLQAIADYVRSLRHDVHGTKIYANLLVRDRRDPAQVVVLARSHDYAGEDRARHPLDEMAVRTCFMEGKTVEIGDVRVDFPKTGDKRYRSILGIPLKSVQGEPRVIGVLSIDSSSPYHFSKWEKQLTNVLLPLTTILELTLERPR